MDRIIQPRKKMSRIWLAGLGLAAAATAWALFSGESGEIRVAAEELRLARVDRGEFVFDLIAPGTLVAQNVFWLTSEPGGRITAIHVQPGARLDIGHPVASLANPDLVRLRDQARWQLEAMNAELAALEVQLSREDIDLQLRVSAAEADHAAARLVYDAQRELEERKIVSAIALKQARLEADQLAVRVDLERQRLAISGRARKAQLDAKHAQATQLHSRLNDLERQVGELALASGLSGVIGEIMVEPGQTVSPGGIIAKLLDPDSLNAELRVSQHQAGLIQPDMAVELKIGDQTLAGRVSRVDPAVIDGAVRVLVRPEAPLPSTVRPDQAVTANIEIARVADALRVLRPSGARRDEYTTVYRIRPDSTIAEPVAVQIGQVAASHVEIRDGLAAGDQIIISDTQRFANAPIELIH